MSTSESDFNRISDTVMKGADLTIGFIGFGLIGGSIARALRKSDQNITLLAYDYHQDTPSTDLTAAVSDEVLNHIVFSLSEGFQNCDIIFLCAPVLSNISYLSSLKSIIKPACILTDVGSVKGSIHKAVQELGLEQHFIGGHPMTGSEKTGYHNSHALLLENSYYILTPTKQASPDKVETLYRLVEKMGAIPILLDANEHDKITAAISHVPHIIAAQLVNLIRDSDDGTEKMKSLAAGGFKDITRIASSSPIMWQNICLTNTTMIRSILNSYIAKLKEASEALERQDEAYLYQMFDSAGEYRNSIPNKSTGLFKKVFEIYLDIADEAGAIATIATILASNQISIKNIGIIHNREFEEGVLRIEFYDEKAEQDAIATLKKHHYRIYER